MLEIFYGRNIPNVKIYFNIANTARLSSIFSLLRNSYLAVLSLKQAEQSFSCFLVTLRQQTYTFHSIVGHSERRRNRWVTD